LSIVAGLHVPVTPLVEVPGKAGAVAPAQIANDPPKLNVGVRIGLTVTLKLAGNAH
jgi:hypothetical protein